MLFNNEYKFDGIDVKNWEGFWNELNVNYTRINEEKDFVEKLLQPMLRNLMLEDLQNILSILKIDQTGEKEDLICKILLCNESMALVYLNSFSKRKKKAIEAYYVYKLYNSEEVYSKPSTLIQLFHLFSLCHTYMFDIAVLDEWQSRGTGYEFRSNNELKKLIIPRMLDVINQENLCKMLSNIPRILTKYRVRMYCNLDESQCIFMIYKLKNDSQKVDFDESKRVKDIEKILFKIDTTNNSIHIKSKTLSERDEIKKYFQKEYNCELQLYEEPIFSEYASEDFKDVFKSLDCYNNPELNNFQINRITFSSCLLNKSPELMLSTPKRDIWPSVVHAFNMKLIDIDSLYGIRNINITINNITRNIRTMLLEDGNIIYKLDDKGLDKETISLISKKFMAMFKIPLNRKIKNILEKGKADDIDFILRSNLTSQLEKSNISTLQELIDDKIVDIVKVKKYLCTNSSCGNQFDYSDLGNQGCPDCGNDELIVQFHEQININYKVIEQYLIATLCNSLVIEKNSLTVTNSKRFGKDFTFHKFIYNKKEYQFLITDKIIPRKILNLIEKQLIPTIIFYYGIDIDQAILMTPDKIEMVQFGLVYVNKLDDVKVRDIFKNSLESLDKRLHYQIISASLLANESLSKIIVTPKDINRKYTSDDFEDDVYAILKDLIFQSEKWGGTERGKPLPEGVLAFAYNKTEGENNIEIRHAFTFDCKLTYSDDGYEIGRQEERKALEYVNTINDTNEVQRYCTNRQLSSHIFIGNKFKDNQIANINKYFVDHLKEGYNTKVVFLQFESLIKMHDWYRKNNEKVQRNRHIFYESLYVLLTTAGTLIDKTTIETLFEELEQCFSDDRVMNIDRIKSKIEKL